MKDDHIDPSSLEELMVINRVFSKKSETWIPALLDKKSHEIDVLWVAAVLYMVYDRYLSCIPDQSQIEFQDSVIKVFAKMLKEGGEEYIYKIDTDEEPEY
jgi:hypothetical protein